MITHSTQSINQSATQFTGQSSLPLAITLVTSHGKFCSGIFQLAPRQCVPTKVSHSTNSTKYPYCTHTHIYLIYPTAVCSNKGQPLQRQHQIPILHTHPYTQYSPQQGVPTKVSHSTNSTMYTHTHTHTQTHTLIRIYMHARMHAHTHTHTHTHSHTCKHTHSLTHCSAYLLYTPVLHS